MIALSTVVCQMAAVAQPQYIPGQNGQNSQPAAGVAKPIEPTNPELIKSWFKKYDEIRRAAQLSARDKAKANELLSKGLAIIIPGDEKVQTQKLLRDLVTRYSAAEEALKQLPLYPETETLHRGYYQYFSQAKALFNDYLTVQNNVLARDQYGNPLAKTLMFRKHNLEVLDQNNKNFDEQLRQRFGVKNYSFK